MANPKRSAAKSGNTPAGRRLIRSVNQAIAWASGEDVPVRITVVRPKPKPDLDVKSMRNKMGLSQARFADRFGFKAATIKNWEQGRTRPDGPALTLLTVIAHNPDAVLDALRKAG